MRNFIKEVFLTAQCLFMFLLPISVKLQEDSCTDVRHVVMPFRLLYKDICPLVKNILKETYDFQIQCSQRCLQDVFCIGFNYRTPKGQLKRPNCQLTHKLDHEFHVCSTDDKGWIFYHYVEERKVPCNNIKNCKNGGRTIIDLNDGPGSDPYRCKCSKEYQVDLCDKFDPDYNFALLKPTAQSTTYRATYGDLLSKYAVDGIKADTCLTAGRASCTHTSNRMDQWWRVDFQIIIPVARVVITNRKDFPDENGLLDFEIKIGNSLDNEGRNNTKCGNRHSVPKSATEEISCSPPLSGRYLVIQSFYSVDRLAIIEVEVFAAGLQVE